MILSFAKMHGLGNDFVVIDRLRQRVRLDDELMRRLADRRFGIGCDQILVVEEPSSPDVDFNYRIFNADGGEVEQCGNGARCFARYVLDKKLTHKRHLRVSTNTGVIELHVQDDGQVRVDMGVPTLSPRDIPFTATEQSASYALNTSSGEIIVGAVSMGNPHVILNVADIASAPLDSLGAEIEQHPRFPNRVNVGFMQVRARNDIALRVFERGVGETLACGTGACAAVVSGNLQELLDSEVSVHLPGGTLQISWPGEGQPVVMTGPASHVFDGKMRL